MALSVPTEYLPQPAAAMLNPRTRAMVAAEAARNRMVMLSPSRADYNKTRGQYIDRPQGRQPPLPVVLDTADHDSVRGPDRKSPCRRAGRRRRAAPPGLRVFGLRAQGTGAPFGGALSRASARSGGSARRHEARRRRRRGRPAA